VSRALFHIWVSAAAIIFPFKLRFPGKSRTSAHTEPSAE
jgi:hypothetical protein